MSEFHENHLEEVASEGAEPPRGRRHRTRSEGDSRSNVQDRRSIPVSPIAQPISPRSHVFMTVDGFSTERSVTDSGRSNVTEEVPATDSVQADYIEVPSHRR
jgi:hypothetical protein